MSKTKDIEVKNDDFSKYFLTDTSVLELKLPNGKPMLHNGKQVKVHLFGPSTDEFIEGQAELESEANRRLLESMAAKNEPKAKAEEPPKPQDKEADRKFLCRVTSHFENFDFPGGVPAIYSERRLIYINKQVQNWVGNMGNFFGNGSKP